MILKIKNMLKLAGIAGLGIIVGCEPEADKLGSQLFKGANGSEISYPLIAYNQNNNDSIKANAAKLDSAAIGAFTEPVFGMQKSTYVTQVRLSAYNPDFGTNPVVDSAVLVLKPAYAADSMTTATKEDEVYNNIPAKKVVMHAPIKKYGKANKSITINVNEVEDFLGAPSDAYYSNAPVALGTLLGSKTINGRTSSVKITKNSDNSELFNRDLGVRIPLNPEVFQNKIVSKKGASQLTDAASFIRYFKGIAVSVAEDDGYIFKINPNDLALQIYYKNDKVENGVTTRAQSVYAMDLGSSNAHRNVITYQRAGTSAGAALGNINSTDGDKKLFAQGMGGPGVVLKISKDTVQKLKDLYKNQKAGIVSAKMVLHTDTELWNNKYKKPSYFTVKHKGLNTFMDEMAAFAFNSSFSLVKAYKLTENPAKYEVSVTKTLKDLVEGTAEAKDLEFVLNVGAYTINPQTGNYVGASDAANAQNYNNRAYTPNRVVLVGTDASNANAASLKITYINK